MTSLRKVEYDPFADTEVETPSPPKASAPEPSPTQQEPAPVEPDDSTPKPPKPEPARPSGTHLRKVDYDPFSDEPAVDKGGGSYFKEIPKGVAAGAVSTTGAMLKGAAAIREQAILERERAAARARVQGPKGIGEVTPITPELRQKLIDANRSVAVPDVTKDPYYQAGLATQDWSDKTFKAAHDFEDSWTRQISEGLGSTLPFVAMNFVPGVGQVASFGAGSLVGVGQQVDDAIKKGASPEQIMSAIPWGTLPGMTEQLPMEVLFERIPLPMWGKFLGYVTKVGAKAFAEGGQEAAQQFFQNLIAKYQYNPKQDLSEGVLQSFIVGATVGGVMAAPFTRPHKPDENKDTSDTVAPEGVAGDPQAKAQPEGPGGQGQPPAPVQNKPATVTTEQGKPEVAAAGAAAATTTTTTVDPTIAAAAAAAQPAQKATPAATAAAAETPVTPVVPGTTAEEEETEVPEETQFEPGEGVSSAMAEAVQAARAKTPVVTTGPDPSVVAAVEATKPRQRKPKVPPAQAATETIGTPEAAARRAAGTEQTAETPSVPQAAAGVPLAGTPAQAAAAPAAAQQQTPAPVEGFQVPQQQVVAPVTPTEAPRSLSPVADILARARGETQPAAVPEAAAAPAAPAEPEVVPGTTEKKLPPKAEAVVEKAKAKHKLSVEEQGDNILVHIDTDTARVGTVQATRYGDTWEITGSWLDESERGKGSGIAAYTKAIEEAFARGATTVKSDVRVSRDAGRMYEALARRGYDVTTNPHVDDNGILASTDKAKPVYEVRPKPKPEPKKKLSLTEKAAKAVKVAEKAKVAEREVEVKRAEAGKTVSKGKVKVEEVKAKTKAEPEKAAAVREETKAAPVLGEGVRREGEQTHQEALADAIKAEMVHQDKEVFSRGDASEVADTVAKQFTAGVDPKTSIASIVKERLAAAVAQVETRLNKRAGEEEAARTAEEEAKHERAREVTKERRLTGAPQDRPRAKEGGRAKTSEEIAAESLEDATKDKAKVEHGKRERGEPHIPEYAQIHDLFQARKATPRKQKPDVTRMIREKRQELVDRLAKEEAAAAPAEPAEAKPTAAEQEAKVKSGPERWSRVDPVIQEQLDALAPDIVPVDARTTGAQMKEAERGLPSRLQNFVKRVEQGLRSLSEREKLPFEIRERVDPKRNSPLENFVAYAKAVAYGRRRGHGPFDVWQAMQFLKNNQIDDFNALITDGQLEKNRDFQSLTGKGGMDRQVVLGDEHGPTRLLPMRREDEDLYTPEELEELRELEKEAAPQYTAADPYFEHDGQKYVVIRLPNGREANVPYHSRTNGRTALEGARAGLEQEGGGRTAYDVIRNFLHKRLIKLVGDIDVIYVSQSEMNALAGGPGIRGLYTSQPSRAQLSGWKPQVLIAQEIYENASPATYHHVLVHEMTHAATVYALETNLNGTHDVIQHLRLGLELHLRMTGLWNAIPKHMLYGLTTNSDAEFIAEVFSNEDFQRILSEIQVDPTSSRKLNQLLASIPMPTWMQAFTKAVSNALGTWSPFGRAGDNYLEQVIRLYPQVFQSTEEQVRSMRENPNRARMRALQEPVEPRDPWDTRFFAHQAQQNAQAVRQAADREPFNVKSNKRWYGLSTTMEIRRRAERWFGKDSAIYGLIDTFLSGRKDFEEERQPGVELTAKAARYADANPDVWREVEDISHDATVNELNPWDALGTGRNSHVKVKKGKLKQHLVPVYNELSRRVRKLPQEAQNLMRAFDAHYGAQHDRKVRLTVETIISDAVANLGVKLPAGVTEQDAVDWVLDGRVDRKEPKDPANPTANERTKYDQDLHDALKGTAQQLRNSKQMRKIKGFYVPLLREGKYFFTAIKDLDANALKQLGGYVDTAKGRENQILFPDEKDYLDFVKNKKPADMQINDVTVDHVDPNTGLPTWPDGTKVSAKDANAMQIYRVHTQNRVMEMHDSTRALKRLQKEYDKQGYKVSAIDEVDRLRHSAPGILPAQINALLHSIEQAHKGSALSQRTIQGAVISAYHKQLTGNRAAHRTLKRHNVRGFSKNLLNAMDTTNRTAAGHIMNLIRAPKMAKFDKLLDEEMSSSRYAAKGGQLARRAAVKEIRKRIEAAATRTEHYTGAGAIRNIMALSFLTHLATPAYVFANLTQPFATTWGVLASHWKGGRGGVLGELAKAYWDLGAGRIMGRGLLETGRQASDVGKKFARAPYDFHARVRNQMAQMPQGNLLVRAMDLLEQLGLSASAGTELPEVSELGMNVASRTLNRIAEVSRTLSTAAEAVNRYVTLLVALRLAKRGKMNDEEAIQYAVSMVEKTQGGYAAENNPNAFSGKYLRAPMQFKKYSVLYGQLYYGALMDMGIGQDKATRIQAAKQLARMSAAAVVLSGVGGLPVMEIAKIGIMAAAMFGLGDEDWEDKENELQQWFAEALKYVGGGAASAEVLMHGASRMLSFDTSSRLGNENMVLFGEPDKYDEADVKSWAWDTLVGAPGGMLGDQAKDLANHDWEKLGLSMMPKLFLDLKKAYDQSQKGVVTRTGRQTVPPTSNLETMWQALGFRPASVARQYEAGGGGAQYKAQKRVDAARTAVMQIYRNASPNMRQKVFRTEIAQWNRAHPHDRIDMGDLRKSVARKKSEAKKQREKVGG